MSDLPVEFLTDDCAIVCDGERSAVDGVLVLLQGECISRAKARELIAAAYDGDVVALTDAPWEELWWSE